MHFNGDEIDLSSILSFYNKTISFPIIFFGPSSSGIRTIFLSFIVKIFLSKTILQQHNFVTYHFPFKTYARFLSPNIFCTMKYFVFKNYDIVTNNLA